MAYKQVHKMITFNCDSCGKEHTQRLSNYERRENHFCSKKCSMEFRWKDHAHKSELGETIECACGCGEVINKYNKWGYEREFIDGHAARLGNSGQFEKGVKVWNDGVPMRKESKEKLRQAALEQFKDGLPEETKIKMSCVARGIPVEEFDGFACNERQADWNSKETKEWRKVVFERDDFTCQECEQRGGVLHAHHIKEWVNYPDLRHDVNNGLTMCKKCHMELHGLTKKEVA